MGTEYKRNKVNHCEWCGKKTSLGKTTQPETPILEFMEEKIDKYGREAIWGEDGDWSEEDLDSDFEAELLVYDQMLTTMSKKIVCISCLKQDDDLWEKYYNKDFGDDEIVFDAEF